jgi:hypothetical protein
MSQVFVSYRLAEPDQQLAQQLVEALEGAQNRVFWDTTIRVGTNWAQLIKQNLTAAEFLVVLLSAESVRSEWVLKEIRLAHRLSRREKDPLKSLPIRVAYQGNPPWRLAAKLDCIQHTRWETVAENQRVVSDIVDAVAQSATCMP